MRVISLLTVHKNVTSVCFCRYKTSLIVPHLFDFCRTLLDSMPNSVVDPTTPLHCTQSWTAFIYCSTSRPLNVPYYTCQHSPIHTTFIHWWHRLPCKVPMCSSFNAHSHWCHSLCEVESQLPRLLLILVLLSHNFVLEVCFWIICQGVEILNPYIINHWSLRCFPRDNRSTQIQMTAYYFPDLYCKMLNIS